MADTADVRWMRLALALGRRGLGRVWPNPAVGCVLVRDGHVVGRGWTADGGRPHAEVRALAQAGAAARGATAYVSLEPCAHTGKTPPCTEALIASGVARVVCACEDPDPRVAGRGIAQLREAGIAVESGVCAEAAVRDHAGFFARVTDGRPLVTLKLAMSLDGRIATASGESQWITGPEARRRGHAMRASHDAVLIGAGTARADDPQLTVRGFGAVPQPVRVVLSRSLDLPLASRLVETLPEAPLWLVHGPEAPADQRAGFAEAGARLIGLPDTKAATVIAALANAGLTRVYCEGGGQLAAALLQADLLDRLAVFSAGLALGGDARAGVGALELPGLAAATRFHLTGLEPVGPDVLSTWERRR